MLWSGGGPLANAGAAIANIRATTVNNTVIKTNVLELRFYKPSRVCNPARVTVTSRRTAALDGRLLAAVRAWRQ
jgi:hypothetical protein